MQHPGRSKLRTLVLAVQLGTAAMLLQPLVTQAQVAASPVQAFDIPAGQLDQALRQFGLESGRVVYADAAVLRGHSTVGLRGQYSATEALSQLLAGTGLVAQLQPDG
ncbi:STN domain-containing protein, partial [Nitrincola lacisaponensis]|uniref:STN domain-containing protein n=1 Tax=Nitrincola lacisaponensis TaxID=267850 RepID=UPI00055FCF1C